MRLLAFSDIPFYVDEVRLTDGSRRMFAAERRRYLGGGGWLALAAGPLEELARRLVPTLGTEQFFEWH